MQSSQKRAAMLGLGLIASLAIMAFGVVFSKPELVAVGKNLGEIVSNEAKSTATSSTPTSSSIDGGVPSSSSSN